MPYLLLVLGLLIGIFALYKFFLRANVEQIKAFILSSVTLTICLALFILSVTGRLPAAIAIVSAAAPFAIAFINTKRKRRPNIFDSAYKNTPMDKLEALRVLDLKDGASEDEIKSAYKRLMKKVHPDQDGSHWMAEKLNEAKDLLLRK